MYKKQMKPDKVAYLSNGEKVKPIVTFKNKYGNTAHIISDDHCYVLITLKDRNFVSLICRIDDVVFVPTTHWFKEAISAVKKLPLPK